MDLALEIAPSSKVLLIPYALIHESCLVSLIQLRLGDNQYRFILYLPYPAFLWRR